MSLNRQLFTTTDIDSGALNVLGSIVHQFKDTGEYRIDLFREGQYVTHRYLVVESEQPRTQVTIDAATLPEVEDGDAHARGCCCDDHDVLYLRENGYLVLDVSRGAGGFAIEVTEAGEDELAFDSRELDEDDHFAVTFMRPGRYVARQLEDGSEATITVPYPTETGRGVPEAERVAVTPDGFDAESLEVLTGQGVVFDVETTARIEIELEEPDDGDGDGGGPTKGRWERSPGQSAGPARFDPVEFGIMAVERKVQKLTSKKELHLLKQREANTKNRTSVIDAVENRLEELAEEVTEEFTEE